MPGYIKKLSPFLFLTIAVNTIAQKLPGVQQSSMRAPGNVIIDGKATEWGNKFLAYNKVIGVYYSIANDDDKLYLTLQATDADIIRKIVLGGVTFTLNIPGKKDDKNGVAITFPAYDKRYVPLYLILNNRPEPTKDTLKNRMQADSFMNAYNDKISNSLKLIGVAGIKQIRDDVISIYNEEGINAASRFDHKIAYTYELAIPLKYLQFTVDKPVKFSYNIKLNGIIPKGSSMVDTGRPDIIVFVGPDGKNYTTGKATPENMALAYPTDFWGEYVLARK